MMNKRLVIFDGNHLAYRAYYKFTNLKTLDGIRTGVVYGMPYVAESLIRKLSPDKVIVAFDGGRSSYRLSLLPDYKLRDKGLGFDYEDFHRQKDIARDLFMSLGIGILWKRGYEADDLISMVTRRYSNNMWDVTIISGDKDFNQLIQDIDPYKHGGVDVYGKTKSLDYFNLKKEVGYEPNQCVDYLSLLGDKSDKIPGYSGMGPVKISQLLDKYGSVKAFLKSGEKFGKVDNEKLKEIWNRNRKLIDLKFFYRKFLIKEAIPLINPDMEFDYSKVKMLCGENEINSFLKPQFIKTFKKLG